MKRFVLVCTLALSSFALMAQAPQPGKVHLKSNDVIAGVVDINSFGNSASVTTEDGRQLTYHASMISSIETTDECDFKREFRCFDYRSNSFFDRMEKKIFQVVSDGKITLLRRVFEYDVFDTTDEYTIEEWYFINKDGKVKRIRNFKRQLYPLMSSHEEAMNAFRERNQLGNLNREENMFLMVSFYNRLHNLSDGSLSLGVY
ncbi:MAG: hypothetical protein ACLFUB_17055 [Cyclobacteriaceae bacterium]